MNTGYLYAAAAFILWGVLPIYWKHFDAIDAFQLVAYRVVFSTLVLVPLTWGTGGLASIRQAFTTPRLLGRQMFAAAFVAANWLGFVWAVTNGKMIESSLGYFLNPLLNVLVGVLVLGERLRRVQWFAIAVAAVGVAWITAQYHHFPWIALFLAGSFCMYGLAKKKTTLGAVPSLTGETLLLVGPALAFLVMEFAGGRGALGNLSGGDNLLIASSGVVTTVPLLCFAAAARRIPLSAIGLMQYLGPSLQFLLGLFVYDEPFDAGKLAGFAIVWAALAIYAIDGLWQFRMNTRRQPSQG